MFTSRPLVRCICGVVLLLLANTSTARADFKAQWQSASPARTLNLSYDADGAGSGGATTYNNVLVGEYNWKWTSGTDKPANTNANNQFWSYCIELTQHVGSNATYHLAALNSAPDPGLGIGGGMGATKANMLQELFDRNYSPNFTNNQGAAFQLAIWEIVFEHGSSADWNVKSGDFQMTSNNSTVANLANNLLWSVRDNGNGNYTGTRKWDLSAMSSPDSQDQIIATPTPAPPGVVLALSGLLPGIVFIRRMRSRLTA